eukprot:jgi/Bigna1/89523/estExt_fgenesh1_pg.C_510013
MRVVDKDPELRALTLALQGLTPPTADDTKQHSSSRDDERDDFAGGRGSNSMPGREPGATMTMWAEVEAKTPSSSLQMRSSFSRDGRSTANKNKDRKEHGTVNTSLVLGGRSHSISPPRSPERGRREVTERRGRAPRRMMIMGARGAAGGNHPAVADARWMATVYVLWCFLKTMGLFSASIGIAEKRLDELESHYATRLACERCFNASTLEKFSRFQFEFARCSKEYGSCALGGEEGGEGGGSLIFSFLGWATLLYLLFHRWMWATNTMKLQICVIANVASELPDGYVECMYATIPIMLAGGIAVQFMQRRPRCGQVGWGLLLCGILISMIAMTVKMGYNLKNQEIYGISFTFISWQILTETPSVILLCYLFLGAQPIPYFQLFDYILQRVPLPNNTVRIRPG